MLNVSASPEPSRPMFFHSPILLTLLTVREPLPLMPYCAPALPDTVSR